LLVSAIMFAMPHLGDALIGRIPLAYLVTGLAFGLVYVWTGSLTAAMVSHSLQSCYAFASVLLQGRGHVEVSWLAYALVFGCPLWVFLCARGLWAIFPKPTAH
ncbi:MAG: CPBP family glutamic-type intramembrane protease, partial [Brachymonas sp.]|nr:CPBP family glutamic-type intramembrane protease [Brachymonas sp.]